jgi:hypothetical protein
MEPIPEEVEDEHLNDSILSFQNFLQDDHKPQEISDSDSKSDSDSHSGNSSKVSDNEDDDFDVESDDEPVQKQIRQRMSCKSPRNASRKKPGPKPRQQLKSLGSKRRRSADIPNVDAYDPRTCGKYFLFLMPSFHATTHDSLYRFQYLRCCENARWQQQPIHCGSHFLNDI